MQIYTQEQFILFYKKNKKEPEIRVPFCLDPSHLFGAQDDDYKTSNLI